MPTLECPCGYVHDLSSIPDKGWLTIAGKEFGGAAQSLVQLRDICGNGPAPSNEQLKEKKKYSQAMHEFTGYVGRLYECPKCERIMWLRSTSSGFQVYEKRK